MSFRSCLYSTDYPEGHVFESETEYNAALESGWVEAPWLVTEKKEPDRLTEVIRRAEEMFKDEVKPNADKPDRKRPYKRRAAPAKRRKSVRNPD